MNILITGCNGFIGVNLIAQLKNLGYSSLFLCDSQTPKTLLKDYLKHCDVMVHLAGVNRPDDKTEFMKVHRDFTKEILGQLKRLGNHCPIIAASSIQAALENPYGRSKRAMEELLTAYGQTTGAEVMIYRLPNVFGKWCRPNYNSVISTFCYLIARDKNIHVENENTKLRLVYIDDVTAEFIKAINHKPAIDSSGFAAIPKEYEVALKEIAAKIRQFRTIRDTLVIPSLENEFDKKLYSTYLSYLPQEQFYYAVDMKKDARGYFSEILKSDSFGQISVYRTKKDIVRGNHWHNSKNEKFLIVEGDALIRFRKIGETEIISYPVSGKSLKIIEVPSGYIF